MRLKGFFLLLNLLFASVASAGVGLPFGLPPTAEDPLMAKIAPDECLLYLTWSGAAAPDPASTNHTEQLVADEEVQTFITEVEKRLTTGILQLAERAGGEQATMTATLAIELGKRLITRPAAFYVRKVDFAEDLTVDAGAVVSVGEHADKLQGLLDELLGGAIGNGLEMVEIDGAKFYRGRPDEDAPQITWGVKGEYFYVGVGEGSLEGILQRATTDPPQWLTAEKARVSLPRVSTFCYVDAKAVAEKLGMFASLIAGGPGGDEALARVNAIVEGLGIDKISHVSFVSGLDETSYVRRSLIGIEGEATGLLSMADAKPLSAADLAPIPRDATIAVSARMDFGHLMDHLMAVIGKMEPRAVEQANRAYDGIKEELGFHIRDDLVGSLGDVWTIYHSPGEGGLLTGLAGVVTVKDHKKLAEIHDKLLVTLKAQELHARREGIHRVPKLGQLPFGGEDVYYWSIPDAVPVLPAWCLTENELIVALFPQTIKAYLSRGDDYQSLATVPEVANLFENGKGPIKIWYQDTPALFEYLYPVGQIVSRIVAGELQRDEVNIHVGLIPSGSAIAKHLSPDVLAVVRTDAGIEVSVYESFPGSGTAVAAVPLMMSFVLVSSGSSSPVEEAVEGIGMILSPEKAAEAEAKNFLKQLGLAMHNHHDTFQRLPAASPTDEDGKPLLSWRVQILPFIEEGNLFEQFHRDEPWDSEHNQQLIAQMPRAYVAPGSQAGEGKTVYLTVRHKDAMFPAEQATRFRDITDGLSNTVMIVEAADESAVIWTKPDDYDLNPEHPLQGLVHLRKGGFLVVMGDGSVQKVSDKIDSEMLNALFTRNGGEIVFLDDRRFDRDNGFDRGPVRAIEHDFPTEKLAPIEKSIEFELEPGPSVDVPPQLPEVEFEFPE